MEGPYLPEESEGEEPSEEPRASMFAERDEWAIQEYERRLAAFEASLSFIGRSRRRRRMSDYTTKNCEEAAGERTA